MNVLLLPFDGNRSAELIAEEVPQEEATKEDTTCSYLQDLKRINNRTSLSWTARALAQSNQVQNVQVVCEAEYHEELRLELPDDQRFQLVDFGIGEFSEIENESLFEQLTCAEEIARKQIKNPTLVTSCATPHWTGDIYDDVISHIRDSNLDSALFYIQDKNVRPKSQEVTYNPLLFCKNPVYVLPMMIVGPEFVLGASSQFEKFSPDLKRLMEAEEKYDILERHKAHGFSTMFPIGWKAVKTLGVGFLWRLMKRSLTPAILENQIKRLFNCRFEFVELNEPHLALSLSNDTHHAKIEALLS
jgi:hypothetical protein